MQALIYRADRAPLAGADLSGPHQIYRRPRLALESRADEVLRDGHVRVEVRLAGVCGSDLNLMQCDPATGYILGSVPLDVGPEGRILGHEAVGQVREVGAGVAGIDRGAWVALESLRVCQRCDACRRGLFNQCARAVLVGMQADGYFREVVDVPLQLVHDVSDLAASDGGRRAAACLEPAACSFGALTRARVAPGDRVLIFGAGPLGAFAALLARAAFGAASVCVVEPLPARRELARRWADRVCDLDEAIADVAPVDVLLECSGDLANVDRAAARMAPNGRIVLLARHGAPLTVRCVDHLITNQVSILGARGHLGGSMSDVLRLERAGRVRLAETVTGVVDGLDALRGALETPAELARTQCKLLVRL